MAASLSPSGRKVKTAPTRARPDAADLLAWYDLHRRSLPWRAKPGDRPDPYGVWLSEIMLQQTTVAAVEPYFRKFIARWPTIRDLAGARPDDVLRMWAGLGYYRRARLLHACCRTICGEYGSAFPATESELLALPGVGPYTAAAIAAIAFDRRANVVDGNVERVVARLFAVRRPLRKAKAHIRKLAAGLLPDRRFGDYAQALMDLGATVCTPRNPKCGLCPWREACRARTLDIAAQLPVKRAAASKPVRRAVAFVLVNRKNEILLRRRPDEGLLGGMMEVPSSAWREGRMPSLARAAKDAPAAVQWRILPGLVRHVFSHFELEVSVAVGATRRCVKGRWVAFPDHGGEALPSVMRKIVRHAGNAILQEESRPMVNTP